MFLPAATAASRVHGPEAGRRGQDDVVGAAVDHLLVGVEADEASGPRHIDRVAQLCHRVIARRTFLQCLAGNLRCDPGRRRQGHDLDVLGRVQDIVGRAGAAAAAADQADLDLSLPAAWTLASKLSWPPAAAGRDGVVFRKSRRVSQRRQIEAGRSWKPSSRL